MLLWSQNIFKRIIEPSASQDIVIFRFKIFTRSMQYQRRSYWQCQPLNIVVSSANTSSYTIQLHEDAVNCNDNCEMWLFCSFSIANVKINKKCQSMTSFSINNRTIHTLPLSCFLSNVILTQLFDLLWSTLSKSLHDSLSPTQEMDLTTPKATISQPKDQIQTYNTLQTAVCCCPNLF